MGAERRALAMLAAVGAVAIADVARAAAPGEAPPDDDDGGLVIEEAPPAAEATPVVALTGRLQVGAAVDLDVARDEGVVDAEARLDLLLTARPPSSALDGELAMGLRYGVLVPDGRGERGAVDVADARFGESFVRWRSPWALDVSLGLRALRWGAVTALRPLDVLTPVDLRRGAAPWLDEPPIAVPALSVQK
ncbi:MAG: hypothetical protein KC635_24605, partial [Myxococcales bacterium]|nr:hypothetical protein [Myxococcales bacterium]